MSSGMAYGSLLAVKQEDNRGFADDEDEPQPQLTEEELDLQAAREAEEAARAASLASQSVAVTDRAPATAGAPIASTSKPPPDYEAGLSTQ
jgi:hypothetical protein